MLPLRASQPSRRFPFVTLLLILVNAGIFVWEVLSSDVELERFLFLFGLVPSHVHAAAEGHVGVLDMAWTGVRFFTSMFLHGGWTHVIGNLWILWIFGGNVEDRMGGARFLLFYLICGVTAGVAQVVSMPQSDIPIIGASGAIAGVLGGSFLLFPRSRVLALWPFFFLPLLIEVPALIFLGLWFVVQVLSSLASSSEGEAGGVAWWAHIGGFLFGMFVHRFFLGTTRSGWGR